MIPIFLEVAGPQKGSSFKLAGNEGVIGRDPSSWICLADASASRRHCSIRNDSGKFTIVDLNSRNGTLVNDIPTHERVLQHGDRIGIGNCLFLFLLHETQAEQSAPPDANEDYWIARSTVEIRAKDSLYLQPENIQTKLQPSERIARGLSALLKIINGINSVREEKTLGRILIESILEVIPAERAVLLISGDDNKLFPLVSLDQQMRTIEYFSGSHTIIDRVMQKRVSILSNDVQQNENLVAVRSLAESKISSLLAVPLIVSDEPSGVLYLDTSDATMKFDEDNLQWMTAVATFSSLALTHVRQLASLKRENRTLREEIQIEQNMIGESKCMQEVYQFIRKVASANSTVLIEGESGTGKELVAHAIHRNSSRAGKPFVVVNCAALTESLLESELFGHEKGAFTGAISQKKGKLEAADGGTVFFDEVGEIPTTLQVKILRVLQERELDRVGGTRPIKIDVRFIAATNRRLEDAIRDGAFRKDLFYRLKVVSITIPPLRERREDISLLAIYFAKKFSMESKKRPVGISAEARAFLRAYDWPGNVRELQNAIERAVVLTNNDVILPEDLPEPILETEVLTGLPATTYYETLREIKRKLLLKAIEEAGGNYSEAARILGIYPNNFQRLVRTLNLKMPEKGT